MSDERPVILCRPDRIGDALIASSCFAVIRAQQPDRRIVFAARGVMRSLFESHPSLAGFVSLPQPTRGQEEAIRRELTDEFRAWNAQTFVSLHPDALSQRAAAAASIPERIGYRSRFLLDRTLTCRVPDHRRAGLKHEAENNIDLLAPFGIHPPQGLNEILRPSVHLPDSWRRSLEVKLAAAGWDEFAKKEDGPFAVVNPAAFAQDLRWPAEDFAWLIRELIESNAVLRVVLVADHVSDLSVQRIRYLLGPGLPGLVDLSGATNLAELGWLLRFASVLVSRNTGTTHLAAAVNCPTVEIFGRTEPRYGPARWRALGENSRVIAAPSLRRGFLESRRKFWQRGHAAVRREDVLAAARLLVDTRPESAPPGS